MTHALQIDTLAFSKKLREAGADEALAEALVEGLAGATAPELVTKADLAKGIETLDDKIDTSVKALDDKIEAVKDEVIGVKTDLHWIKGIGAAILAVLILPWLAELAGSVFN